MGRTSESQRLRTRLISAVPVAVVVSASHPLAERRSVTVSSLDDQPLITLPRGSGLRALLDDAFGARGLMPRIVAEAHDLRLLIGLAAEGLGAALVPWTAAAAAVPGARVLALTRPRLEHRAAVAWNPGATSPAGRAFLRLAETHLVLTPGNDAPCTDGKPESGAARSHDGPD